MPIEFYCPECNRMLRVDDSDAGREANCPGCDSAFVVPEPHPGGKPEMTETMPYPAPDGAPARIVPSELDIVDVLRNTWEIFKENALLLIGTAILVVIIQGAGAYATKLVGTIFGGGIVFSLAHLANTAFGVFIGIGMTKMFLEVARGRPAELGMLLGGGDVFLPVVGGWILFALMVIAGFVLFIIPGIIVLLMFGQHYFLIIDRQIAVLDSFPASRTITNGNKMTLLALWIVGVIASFLFGIVTLGIGLFVAGPFFVLSGIVAYLMMCGER